MEKFKGWLLSTAKTTFWFTGFCISVPIFLMYYLVLSLLKSLWLNIVTTIDPNIDFVKVNSIRNILDTRRNQGIIHVLLHIEGEYDLGIVKEALLAYVLERRNTDGDLLYPKLRQTFRKKWGYYAWRNNAGEFNIDNHVVLGPSHYLSRPVNESNIQESVCGITSKYMPEDIPQWQIVIIPSAGTGANTKSGYFMLFRMHHLILAEEEDLKLSDILLATPYPSTSIPLSEATATNSYEPLEPFGNFIPNIVCVPKLYNELASIICNKWNELLSTYSRFGVDNNSGRNNHHGLFEFAVLTLISFVTVLIDFSKDFSTLKDDAVKYLFILCCREMERRNLTFKCLINSIIVSLHPRNLIESTFNLMFWVTTTWCVLLPIMWYKEMMAMVRFLLDNQQPNSSYSIKYGILIYNAATEILDLVHMFVVAPRKIYEELFEKKNDSHALQNLSRCGRKVVSWSDKINFNDVAKICRSSGSTSNEVFFSAASSALCTFLEEYETKIPNDLDACARYVERDYILGHTNYSDDVTGYILVKLPMAPHSPKQMEKIRESFSEVRRNQFPLFLLHEAQRRFDILTKILPQCWIELLFNYLSKKFTVSITKLANGNPHSSHPEIGKTLWEDRILDVIYFTPPQSNISVSLTIQQFGQHIRLSVMADAIILPFHNKISQTWSQYIHDMLE